MLVTKGGITHNIADKKWPLFKEKGYEKVEQAAVTPKPVDSMTVAELKAYATEVGIDLGDAEKKADILAKIKETESGV